MATAWSSIKTHVLFTDGKILSENVFKVNIYSVSIISGTAACENTQV